MDVVIPRRLVEELKGRGFDVESLVIDVLVKSLGLDPKVAVESHLELSLRYLDEGKALVDRDPVQASEKLYKAVEEAVKAFAVYYNLDDILRRVSEKGRWTAGELEKTVLRVSERLGEWFLHSWDNAWALHVWGFHEAKLDSEDVLRRLPSIERLVLESLRIVREDR
jgi:hypothetical protein